MPATITKKVLAHATAETRNQINRILKYPQDSAGTVMTAEFVDLKREMTVSKAFERIRKIGPDKETIYTCYVIDEERKIEGVITVKTLLLSAPEQVLGDIMEQNLILVHTDTDREEVARIFEKYDFVNVPVVDSENRLVGIITFDDIMDVVQEEATEDFEIMAAMTPSERPYLKTGVLRLFSNRIGWLVVLMVLGMGTGFILQGFQDALLAAPLLISFIPMLTDTGGNAGSQSSTMIIRGMAVSEISPGDFFRVAWKEIRVSILAGIVLAVVAFLRVLLLNYGEANIYRQTAVISLTLIFTVFMAKLCGAMLPILAKKLKIDPAVMAAPLITTIVDAGSLLVFFSIAKILLGI
jgi:magnesium transporter